jgi:hypothetical protein
LALAAHFSAVERRLTRFTIGAGGAKPMKQQVARFSPHQNGKVFAVLTAVSSLVFVVPFMLFASFASPPGSAPPFFVVLLFPLLYLVLGYVMVAIGCAVYNFMFKYIGGIEYEARETDA